MDNISYDFIDVEIPDFNPEFFSLWLNKVAAANDSSIDWISYVFCSDEYLRAMNREHLNHDYYTDIITFPFNEKVSLQGDVFISYERVVDNASGYGDGDTFNELCRVMVHGLLHLLGFGDKTRDETLKMRAKEEESLKLRGGFT